MKKLTALTLAAALVPALALGTAAFAQEQGGEPADHEGIGEEQADEQRDDALRDDELRAGEQRDDEQFMSRKPAGALYTDGVIGKTVKHRESGDNVGEIKDLIIGDDGRVLGAVITTGGFLGLGGQDVSLGWDHLERVMEDDRSVFYVDMDKETLRNAPEHERD